MKEIRKDAVRLYTGIGALTSKDGIFSKEERLAVSCASGISDDALDIYKREQVSSQAPIMQDSVMHQPGDSDQEESKSNL